MRKILEQLSVWLVALALGGAALVAGSALAVSHSEQPKPKPRPPRPRCAVDESPVPRAAGPYTSFAPIVKKVAPGVVKIVVTSKAANISCRKALASMTPSGAASSATSSAGRCPTASSPPAPARPRLGRHRHQRRLHPHQQPRRG